MNHNLTGSFERDISYRISRPDQDRILLTATMRDVYHHIVLEVLVREDDLCILTAHADFHRSPELLCPSVAERLLLLAGVRIGKGLHRAILNAMGGEHGCANLCNLLSGLLPLAINVKAARGFKDEQTMFDTIRDTLAGTCAGYPQQERYRKENNDKSHIC